jgi:alpha-1,2-mannosyltransferase
MSTPLKIFLIALAAIFGFAAVLGITSSITLAIAGGMLIAGSAGWLIYKFPIIHIEQSALTRGLQIVSMIGILLALLQLIRLTGFMIDPAKRNLSSIPWSQWDIKHNCLTAYFIAAQSAKTAPDIYSNSLYSMPDDDPTKIRKPKMLGAFRIDVYEYPPPFLLLSRAISFTDDFLRVRLLWFGINGIVILIAMLMIARSLGPTIGTRAQLLIPVVFAGLPTINTLQKGNVQLLIVAVSMIAMSFIARKNFYPEVFCSPMQLQAKFILEC